MRSGLDSIWLVLGLLWFLGQCTELQAEESNPILPTSIEISTGEWPPFLGAELPEQGVIARLIRDIFAEAQISVQFTFLPWSRAMHDTVNGKYAATAVWMFADDRAKNFLYSAAVLNEKFVFFYRKSQPFYWQQLTDLQGMIVGGVSGYSYGPNFDAAVKNHIIGLDIVGTVEQNFQRLALGRVDVVAEEISVGYHMLQQRLPDIANSITHHPQPLLVNQSFLLFPKTNPQSEALNLLFNTLLQEFRANGRYDDYFDTLTTAESGSFYQPLQP
ncbi:substrate-binding periplasmic protein [Alishewanella longhuensis]|uniref:substrate-binding periplasmic protein n=1 Tax=Alishewanella longhuensis TaxID=1091037 RepID=UPI00167BAEC2|nr:transporter substrate-binding domain-containing protein [Alishewanella longhuensis]